MKDIKRLLYTLPFSLVGATLYTIANKGTPHHFHGAANLFLVLILTTAVLFAWEEGLRFKKLSERLTFVEGWTHATKVTAIPLGILTCLCGANFLWDGLTISLYVTKTISPVLSLVVGVSMVCGGVYAILCPAPDSKNQARDSLFGMILPIGCVVRVLQLYFDTTTPRNASVKLLISLAYLVLALYLLSDVRMTQGRANMGYHKALSLLTPSIIGAVALGEIISALINDVAFPHGVADILFFAVSFLLIYIRGSFAQEKPEIEDHDIA